MRRLLICSLFLVLSGYIINLAKNDHVALAAENPGQFRCLWYTSGSSYCGTDINGNSCQSGYSEVPQICLEIKNPSECDSASFGCVEKAGPRYSCKKNQGCVQDPNGYDSLTSCQNTCKELGAVKCPEGCTTYGLGSVCYAEPLDILLPKPCESTLCIPSAGDKYTQYYYDQKSKFCYSVRRDLSPVFLCVEDGSCQTAIGTIFASPEDLVKVIMQLVIGLVGGVALLVLILTGYQLMTSSGDPQKLAVAKELIVSVITGILMIVFSMVLLQAIGVDILKIPALVAP